MKKILFFIAAAFACLTISAVPAKKGVWKYIELTDGSKVWAQLRGDEVMSYWQSQDGKCFSFDSDSQKFKERNIESIAPLAMSKCNKIAAVNKKRRINLGDEHQPFIGKKKGIIILAQYKDKKFKSYHDVEYYKKFLNQVGFTSPYGHNGSVKDYFLEQSNGKFEFDFDIYGPVTLSNNYVYYGAHSDDEVDVRAGKMIAEACKLAYEQNNINFSDYDWDNDGEVEQVFVIYAGMGEAAGGDENTIWPHKSELSSSDYGSTLVFDNIKVDTYACGSEQSVTIVTNHFTGTSQMKEYPAGIGTICHEFSHCFGLPDLYDTASKKTYGMGKWSLLDTGSYNGEIPGYQPANYTAYEKMYVGWLDPIVLDKPTSVRGLLPSSRHGSTFIIYNDANKDEYFLLENRQQEGLWDSALPGNGLMVTHVDFDINIWHTNHVNSIVDYSSQYGDAYKIYDNDHTRMTIIPAGNKVALESTALYPYDSNNELTDTSTPAANVYTGGSMGKPITNIVQNEDGTIDFDFMGGSEDNIISNITTVDLSNDGTSSANHRGVFTLDGRYLGTSTNGLRKGFYIVNGKKVVK